MADLVGLVLDCLLTEREPEAMAEHGQQMNVEGSLVPRAPERLSIQSQRLVFGRAWGQSSQNALSPDSELGFDLLSVQMTQDRG